MRLKSCERIILLEKAVRYLTDKKNKEDHEIRCFLLPAKLAGVFLARDAVGVALAAATPADEKQRKDER